MRLQKSIKIDDNEYTVRELTVEEIIDLFSKTEFDDGSNSQDEKKLRSIVGDMFGGQAYVTNFLNLAMPGTDIKKLIKLAPSELMILWDVVKEVNKYFFDLAQSLDLGMMIVTALKEILTHFSEYAVVLSKEAMGQEFSNLDTPSLSKQ